MANMIQSSYGKMGMPQRSTPTRQQISRTGSPTFTSPGQPSMGTPTPIGGGFTSPGRISGPRTDIRGGGEGKEKSYEEMLRERALAERAVAEELDPMLRIARENRELQLADLQKRREYLQQKYMNEVGPFGAARTSFRQWMDDPSVRGRMEGERMRQQEQNLLEQSRAAQMAYRRPFG